MGDTVGKGEEEHRASMTSVSLSSPMESPKMHGTDLVRDEKTPGSVVVDTLEESAGQKEIGVQERDDEVVEAQKENMKAFVDNSAATESQPYPPPSESTIEDTDTSSTNRSPQASSHAVSASNDSHRPATITTSPRTMSVNAPRGPKTPITPTTPRIPDITRDSMASVALSQSSLDYDHLSTEQVEECLTTPKARTGHNRRPSSLEILQNSWQPKRQSTMFDTAKDAENVSITGPDTGISSPDLDDEGNSSSVIYGTAEAVSFKSNSSARSVALVDSPASTRGNRSTTVSSVQTPRRNSVSSEESREVDWSQLDKNEEQEKEDKEVPEGSEDESTAFLLARLEQENAMLTSDPKSAANKHTARARSQSRPPSIHALKKMVKDRDQPSIRYSMNADAGLPAELPPMTELDFWAALVQNYPSTASRLPTLTAAKIRAGVPEPLRGVVWTSMSGARDKRLEEAYDNLLGEKSPYEGIINKDVGRSFPGVELFRDAEGEGQKMLGRVLKCFSLHDKDIGYCQGLGFLVGPLLMNMGEREAFCVLVRLMDHYALRPSFLPSLSGLHMRIYQFSTLLSQHHPELSSHLMALGVEPAYLSQWFLSCFATTCPLDMLFRIYNVVFAEGANETIMRVALALMRRNEKQMLESTEFEDVMKLLLGRGIWDVYACNADELVDDFTSLGSIVTYERLTELERDFNAQSNEAIGHSAGFLPDVQAAASRFLGRLWAPNHNASKSTATLSPSVAEKDARPASTLRRSQSKQSVSTLNDSSGESTTSSGAISLASTAATEVERDAQARESAAETMSMKSKSESMRAPSVAPSSQGFVKEQQDLHAQIEDLLTALSEMQREHAQLAAMLQMEREDRSEDHRVVRQLVGRLRTSDKNERVALTENKRRTMPPPARSIDGERPGSQSSETQDELDGVVDRVNERLQNNARFSTSFETKAQLRSTITRTREQLATEEARSRDLVAQLDGMERTSQTFQDEAEDLREQVKELRTRVADDHKDRQKLEHTIRELTAQARSVERKERLARAESLNEAPSLARTDTNDRTRNGSIVNSSGGGLRELRLGRRDSSSSLQSLRPLRTQQAQQTYQDPTSPSPPSSGGTQTALSNPPPTTNNSGFTPRSSSLATPSTLQDPETHAPAPEDAMLLELVNAKTSEAEARQEVDQLRRDLAVAKRSHEGALEKARAEVRAEMDAEVARRVASSVPGTPGNDDGGVLLSGGGGGSGEGSGRSTPTAGSPLPTPEITVKKAEGSGSGSSGGGGGGGWFWSRRAASREATPS
ncbi:hypothetical protein MBLNU230_g7765t1 [Neophaeotheca triangularis]